MSEVEKRLQKTRLKQRVLSIQSHVVSGYAGNKCAIFPLQLHGFETDSIMSVQFSTHTGYSNGIRGKCMNAADLSELFEGLEANSLTDYSHVLTGYCGDVGFLRVIVSIVKKLKASNPGLLYVCDPVLGDDNHYYVPKDLMPIYRDEVLAIADVLTPNAFELSQITGLPVTSEEECLAALEYLHQHSNARYIVVTSGIEASATQLRCYAYESRGVEPPLRHRFTIPRIAGYYVGTGDVFAALLLVWLNDTNGDLRTAVERTILSLRRLLERTHDRAYGSGVLSPSSRERELCLIECRLDLLQPSGHVDCQLI